MEKPIEIYYYFENPLSIQPGMFGMVYLPITIKNNGDKTILSLRGNLEYPNYSDSISTYMPYSIKLEQEEKGNHIIKNMFSFSETKVRHYSFDDINPNSKIDISSVFHFPIVSYNVEYTDTLNNIKDKEFLFNTDFYKMIFKISAVDILEFKYLFNTVFVPTSNIDTLLCYVVDVKREMGNRNASNEFYVMKISILDIHDISTPKMITNFLYCKLSENMKELKVIDSNMTNKYALKNSPYFHYWNFNHEYKKEKMSLILNDSLILKSFRMKEFFITRNLHMENKNLKQ